MLIFIIVCAAVAAAVATSAEVIDLCENAAQFQCICVITSSDDANFPLYDIDCSASNNITFHNQQYEVPENIYFMDFSSSNISNLTQLTFLNHHTVKKLFLYRNSIKNTLFNILYLPELIYLDLNDNLIEYMNSTFLKYMPKLKTLDLSGNRIKNIDLKTFSVVPDLTYLILNDNPLGDEFHKYSLFDDQGLGLNARVEMLCLDGINLSTLPDNFLSDAYNLRHLSLKRNNISIIPELPMTLECLDLSRNPINSLDADDFSNVLTLKELYLNDILIKGVDPYTFANLKNLMKLTLEGNRNMSYFSKLAFGKWVLEDADDFKLLELSFRGSSLQTLNHELEEPFSRLSLLDLQGNPWICDCRMVWIKRFQLNEIMTEHVRCYQPMNVMNYKLFELPDDNFTCSHQVINTRAIYTFFALALFTFLISLAFWLVFVYPKFSHRKTFIENMVSTSSPYNRIVIEPNLAEDYR